MRNPVLFPAPNPFQSSGLFQCPKVVDNGTPQMIRSRSYVGASGQSSRLAAGSERLPEKLESAKPPVGGVKHSINA